MKAVDRKVDVSGKSPKIKSQAEIGRRVAKPYVVPENFGLQPGAELKRRTSRRGRAPSLHGHFAGTGKAFTATPTESLLERDFLTLIEVAPGIRSYSVQGHQLFYMAEDKHGRLRQHIYTPDVTTEDKDGNITVMEVKARGIANMERWQRLEPYIRQAYEDLGVTFCVFTEDTIRIQPRLSNCEIVLSHGRTPLDHAAEILVRRALAALPEAIRIERLYNETGADTPIEQDRIFCTLMHLALRGVVILDMSNPLSRKSALISVRQ